LHSLINLMHFYPRFRAVALLAAMGAVLAEPSSSSSSSPPPAQPPPALSSTPRCSACVAVATALHTRLAAEAPRNDLDWRGRIGPSGERRGVRLAYEVSEARLDALLDSLCTDGLATAVWWARDGGGDDADAGVWAIKGETPPPGWSLPASQAEREARAKRLENACGGLVADWEDELGAALLRRGKGGADDGDDDVGVLLCERLAEACGAGEGRVREKGEGAGGSGKDEL